MEENLLLQAPHSNVQFRLRLFRSQEHSIPILNGSEMEKIKTWHLGFVIAMETIGFFMTSSIVRFINTTKRYITTWLRHKFLSAHRGSCTWRLYETHKTKEFRFSLDFKSLSFTMSQLMTLSLLYWAPVWLLQKVQFGSMSQQTKSPSCYIQTFLWFTAVPH